MWIFFFFFPWPALAEFALSVHASREAEVVSGKEWEQKGGQVETALPRSGLSFVAYGGPGQTRSVSIRGARAEDTLVLWNGIPLNDPSSPSRAFDFSQIPSAEIDRIEILKGPQSVLFGSDALGGVVQFFTKPATDRLHSRLEGGSYGTIRARASDLGFHAGYEQSAGFSAADARDGNTEKDGHRAWNFGGVQDLPWGPRTNLRVQGLFHQAKTDTDRAGGPGGDSAGTFTRNSQLLFRAEASHASPSGYEWTSAGSLFSRERDDNTLGPAYYRSTLWKAETRVRRTYGSHTPTLGAEYSEEAGRSSEISGRKKLWAGAAFLHHRYAHGRFEANTGGRLDFHSGLPKAFNFSLGASYWILPGMLRGKMSLGSGFKAPSLYQTYSAYGSPSLSPSRSLGGDSSLSFTSGGWEADLTYFESRFRGLIDFNLAINRYFNIGRASSRGIELTVAKELGAFRLTNSFTATRAVDENTGLRLLRRPLVADTIELGYGRGDRWAGSAYLRYEGKREDVHPLLFTRQLMPAFFTLGANGFYRLAEGWKAVVRGENLLDRHYQETSGFGTAGASAYLGLEADL